MLYKYINNNNYDKSHPIWIMRQAGRYLPEYREIRKKYKSFLEFCYSVDDAAEVTLQPIRRYDLDAAIIFSDILVIHDALKYIVEFKESVGPLVKFENRINNLNKNEFNKHLTPVYQAIKKVRNNLHKDKSLIGFSGGVFTLLAYLIEGKTSKDFASVIDFIRNNHSDYQKLNNLFKEAVILHLKNQIDSGVDTIKIFDSHAGIVPDDLYHDVIIKTTKEIVEAIRSYNDKIVIICFPRGSKEKYLDFAKIVKPDVLALDQFFDLREITKIWQIKGVITQGNINPEILLKDTKDIAESVKNLKKHIKDHKHIFNLGHGVIKTTNPDNMAFLINELRS